MGLYRHPKRVCTETRLWEKNPAALGTPTYVSIVPWLFSKISPPGCSTSWAISTPWYKEKDHQLRSCSPGCRCWNWLGDPQHIWQWSPLFPAAWHQGSIPGCCSCSRSRPCPCFSQGASGQAVAPASEPGNTDRHWPSAGGDRLFIYSSVSDCSCF